MGTLPLPPNAFNAVVLSGWEGRLIDLRDEFGDEAGGLVRVEGTEQKKVDQPEVSDADRVKALRFLG